MIRFASASSDSFGTGRVGRIANECGCITSSASRSVVRTRAPSYTCTTTGYSLVRSVIVLARGPAEFLQCSDQQAVRLLAPVRDEEVRVLEISPGRGKGKRQTCRIRIFREDSGTAPLSSSGSKTRNSPFLTSYPFTVSAHGITMPSREQTPSYLRGSPSARWSSRNVKARSRTIV